jgi:hypothetical protein
MMSGEYPYNLPIWRRYYRSISPDGCHIAQIDPAYEVSMGNPTSGMLCITGGPHIERCNPSFLWSDDSQYLAAPQFFERFGVLRRQRLLILAMKDRRVFASNTIAFYFQPESFSAGQLIATTEPFSAYRDEVRFNVPGDLFTHFTPIYAPWPEAPPS